MMGITMPTQSSLADLSTLLKLLQAASDPVTAQAAIDKISEERQKYDNAIAESLVKAQEARDEAAKIASESSRQQTLAAKAAKMIETANERAAEVKDQADDLAKDQAIFDAYKAEIAKQAKENADLKAEQDAYVKDALNGISKQRVALEEALAAAVEAKAATEATRGDYEAKLAKFKALTE